jgi:hypothetical protein
MRNTYGLAAALLAASMTSPYSDLFHTETPRRAPKTRPTSPNDHGPVIDTTPESKRARRRRIAKAANVAKDADNG